MLYSYVHSIATFPYDILNAIKYMAVMAVESMGWGLPFPLLSREIFFFFVWGGGGGDGGAPFIFVAKFRFFNVWMVQPKIVQ